MFPSCFPPLTAFHEMCQKEALTVLIAFLTLRFRRYETKYAVVKSFCSIHAPKSVCSLSVSTVFACVKPLELRSIRSRYLSFGVTKHQRILHSLNKASY